MNSKKGFSLLAGINRPISPGHVTKLSKSLCLNGILRDVIVAEIDFISGQKQTYIIDGQHLYHALIRENQDIPYKKIKINDLQHLVETIALLNASSKNWVMADYLLSWSALHTDYKKLNHYYNVYDISLTQLANIFHNGSAITHGGGLINGIVKSGNFRIKKEAESIILLDYVTDTLKIIPRMDRASNKLFVGIYVEKVKSCGSQYDHTKFTNYLKANKKIYSTVTGDPEEISKLIDKAL